MWWLLLTDRKCTAWTTSITTWVILKGETDIFYRSLTPDCLLKIFTPRHCDMINYCRNGDLFRIPPTCVRGRWQVPLSFLDSDIWQCLTMLNNAGCRKYLPIREWNIQFNVLLLDTKYFEYAFKYVNYQRKKNL